MRVFRKNVHWIGLPMSPPMFDPTLFLDRGGKVLIGGAWR